MAGSKEVFILGLLFGLFFLLVSARELAQETTQVDHTSTESAEKSEVSTVNPEFYGRYPTFGGYDGYSGYYPPLSERKTQQTADVVNPEHFVGGYGPGGFGGYRPGGYGWFYPPVARSTERKTQETTGILEPEYFGGGYGYGWYGPGGYYPPASVRRTQVGYSGQKRGR